MFIGMTVPALSGFSCELDGFCFMKSALRSKPLNLKALFIAVLAQSLKIK
jgi:hypothetical protein